MGKYKNEMPLFAMARFGQHLVVGGGGGNPDFGKPNGLYLLDKEYNIVDKCTTEDIVTSIRASGDILHVHFLGNTGWLMRADEHAGARKFSVISKLEKEMHSPVFYRGSIYYVTKHKGIDCFTVVPEATRLPTPAERADVVSVFPADGQIHYITNNDGDHLLHYGKTVAPIEGPIKDYALADAEEGKEKTALALIVKEPSQSTSLRFVEPRPACVLEEMLTCICAEGRSIICGTGDGKICVYRDGKLLARKKIKDTPITNVAIIDGVVHYSTLGGELQNIPVPAKGLFQTRSVVLSLFVFFLAVLARERILLAAEGAWKNNAHLWKSASGAASSAYTAARSLALEVADLICDQVQRRVRERVWTA